MADDCLSGFSQSTEWPNSNPPQYWDAVPQEAYEWGWEGTNELPGTDIWVEIPDEASQHQLPGRRRATHRDIREAEEKEIVLKFLVGEKSPEETFEIPARLIYWHSDMLFTAFTGQFIEAEERAMRIYEPVRRFKVWVVALESDYYNEDFITDSSTAELARVWIMGDYFICPAVQNYIMKFLYQRGEDGTLFHDKPTTYVGLATSAIGNLMPYSVSRLFGTFFQDKSDKVAELTTIITENTMPRSPLAKLLVKYAPKAQKRNAGSIASSLRILEGHCEDGSQDYASVDIDEFLVEVPPSPYPPSPWQTQYFDPQSNQCSNIS